eukprot:m.779410 g.779410  ORF g.779410 m.779410 type:complete len:205 (+) comp59133_c0_seq12:109-723(+)
MFKFMAMYSFTEFISVLILYYFGGNLGDIQYLFVDFFVCTSLALTMSRMAPSATLAPDRPPGSLVTPTVLLSILIHIGLTAAVQAAALLSTKSNSWYLQPIGLDDDDGLEGDGNTAIFIVANFQYIALSLAFSVGKPFRTSFFQNLPYVINVVLLLFICSFLIFDPPEWLAVCAIPRLPRRLISSAAVSLRLPHYVGGGLSLRA